MYFDQLLFLVPSMDNRQTNSNAHPLEEEEEEDVMEIKTQIEESGSTQMAMPHRANQQNMCNEEFLQQILKEKKVQEYDQDTYFALSLVPMLKELPANEKLDAQIRILQVFKSIRQGSSPV